MSRAWAAIVGVCVLSLVATTCGGVEQAPPARVAARPPFVGEDLRDYYPDLARYTTQYLDGDNFTATGPRPSVLWFERQDGETFRVYNSHPGSEQSRCNYDDLSWWKDGFLRYVRTVVACGTRRTEIVYDSPIIFLPRVWDGRPWSLDGRSGAQFFVNGRLRCEGTNAWTAQILGLEELAPGDFQLHWRTTQTTAWATGDVLGGCYAGTVTHWREDYWLTTRLPDPRGAARGKGLARTMGGNLDLPDQSWDVRMARWVPLPTS